MLLRSLGLHILSVFVLPILADPWWGISDLGGLGNSCCFAEKAAETQIAKSLGSHKMECLRKGKNGRAKGNGAAERG